MSVLKKLIPIDDLKKTVQRFPYSALCSFFLFTLIILEIHDVIDMSQNKELFGRLVVLSSYGFFWFGLARLIVEGYGWDANRERVLGYSVFAVLVALVIWGSGFMLAWFLGLMIPALMLGISVGPYLASKDNLSLWFYNRQTWQGVSVSILAGLIWGAGISAALGSIHYLFDVKINTEVYGDIWAFSMIVFAPLYALSWVPEKYSYTEEDCHAPPQLAFVLNWVLAPLVIVYMLILYAYFIKVLMISEMPRGQLSYMVSVFGGVGVLTYLSGWPLREDGGPFLKVFYRLFFPALIVPVIMQAISIYMRIEQYGVTEQRYLVALSTVWFAVLAVLYTVKKPPIKSIPGILAVMLVVAALGPFNAPNVSERSQMARLEFLLVKNKILVDGRITKSEQEISLEDRQSISSILTFLSSREKLEKLRPWLAEAQSKNTRSPGEIAKMMGFDFAGRAPKIQQKEGYFKFSIRGKPELTYIRGYDYVLSTQTAWLNENNGHAWKRDIEVNGVAGYNTIKMNIKDGIFVVGVDEKPSLKFDLNSLAQTQYRNKSSEDAEMILEAHDTNIKARIIIQTMEGMMIDKNPVISNLRFTVIVGKE